MVDENPRRISLPFWPNSSWLMKSFVVGGDGGGQRRKKSYWWWSKATREREKSELAREMREKGREKEKKREREKEKEKNKIEMSILGFSLEYIVRRDFRKNF